MSKLSCSEHSSKRQMSPNVVQQGKGLTVGKNRGENSGKVHYNKRDYNMQPRNLSYNRKSLNEGNDKNYFRTGTQIFNRSWKNCSNSKNTAQKQFLNSHQELPALSNSETTLAHESVVAKEKINCVELENMMMKLSMSEEESCEEMSVVRGSNFGKRPKEERSMGYRNYHNRSSESDSISMKIQQTHPTNFNKGNWNKYNRRPHYKKTPTDLQNEPIFSQQNHQYGKPNIISTPPYFPTHERPPLINSEVPPLLNPMMNFAPPPIINHGSLPMMNPGVVHMMNPGPPPMMNPMPPLMMSPPMTSPVSSAPLQFPYQYPIHTDNSHLHGHYKENSWNCPSPQQYPVHPMNFIPYNTPSEIPYFSGMIPYAMDNAHFSPGPSYSGSTNMMPFSSMPIFNVAPNMSVPPPPLPLHLNSQVMSVTIGTNVGPFIATKETSQFELSQLERSWEGGQPESAKPTVAAPILESCPNPSSSQNISDGNESITSSTSEGAKKKSEENSQNKQPTKRSKTCGETSMNSSNGKRAPMNSRNKESPNHIPVPPPDIQEEVIKFICDSWNKVYQEYQRDNSAVSFHVDSDLPEGFVPFDLDAYWGKRMVQNKSSQNVPTQNL